VLFLHKTFVTWYAYKNHFRPHCGKSFAVHRTLNGCKTHPFFGFGKNELMIIVVLTFLYIIYQVEKRSKRHCNTYAYSTTTVTHKFLKIATRHCTSSSK
jgi:hypothetical protein